jgi:DNA-binding CsgD family transcriptional regulator
MKNSKTGKQQRPRAKQRSQRLTKTNPSTALAVAKLSARSQEARNRALHALTAIRHGASLAEAAKAEGVSQRTIRKYVGSALRQDHVGGRIRAIATDRFTRYLQIPGQEAGGPTKVSVKGIKQATELAAYVNARAVFLRTGDTTALRPFEGKKIGGHTLVTDPQLLTALAEQGDSFDQLYSSLVG